MNRPTDRRRRVVRAAAIPAALLASAMVVWQGSYAAFSATTDNPGNSWATGNVSLTDDDAGSALFTATLLKPTSTGQKCIVVTSNSTVFGPVKLYAGGLSANALSSNATEGLNLKVELANPGGTFVNNALNCGALATPTSLYTGTIAGLSASSNYATGLGAWTPAASGETRVYRFTYTLPAAATTTVAGQTATAGFTWEIQV
jgi:hypothetical protein